MFVIALVPVLLGLFVGWSGYLGWRERLPRDRGAGVRTPATLRSDEAFRIGNKLAGLPTMAAGLVGVLAGAAGLAMPTVAGMIVAVVLGIAVGSVLVVAGGLLGHRAAGAVPAPAPESHGCSGCACGAGGCFGAVSSAEGHTS